jgi:hypothetical protein
MLNAYLSSFTNLIQAPSAPVPLISAAQATAYINSARGQVASEGECIRVYSTLAVTAASQQYAFSAITVPAGTQGVQGVLNVRLANYSIPGASSGAIYIRPRPWEWFQLYHLSKSTPVAAPPAVFAQYGQGALGTLWFNLLDTDYTVNLDTVCYPIPLVDDTTFEAIPYLWTDAVPYYAAWLGMMQEQRQSDADRMMERYKDLMQRARKGSTPSVLPGIYAQGDDPFMTNRLGISPARGAA